MARTLGGSVTARNRQAGRAVMTLTLPISAITLEGAEPNIARAPAVDRGGRRNLARTLSRSFERRSYAVLLAACLSTSRRRSAGLRAMQSSR